MGSKRSRKHRREPAAPAPEPLRAEPPKPFHTPFRDLASALALHPAGTSRKSPATATPLAASGSLAAKPAAAKRDATAATSSPATTTPGSASTSPSGAAMSDDEALAAEFAGVERLAPLAPRVRLRRKPDLSHIDVHRREDVDAMAKAEGFHIAHEDRYVRGRASGVSRETLARLENGGFRICAHLDLHRMPLEDARRAVDEFLANQQKRGHRCVLIVTGKGKNSPRGEGVLREQVPEWLARGPSARRVLAFATARPCDGGLGALVVLMRGDSSSKNRIEVEHGGVGPIEA